MRTYEISSPNAAELYFNNSILGHVAMLLADALGSARKPRRTARPGSPVGVPKRVVKPAETPRPGLLDRLDAWFWRQEQKEREAYLARSCDIFELERRMEALDRDGIARYD